MPAFWPLPNPAAARENAGHVRAVAEIVEPRQARDDGGEILEERDVLEIVVD